MSANQLVSLLLPLALAASLPAAERRDRAAWLGKAQWGVFMHFLADDNKLPVEEWNRRVDGFDVEGLARQLESVGARYFFITIGQNSGHYLAPNPTYDRLTGIKPSKCSRRDLVSDLYAALNPRGIKLLVYLSSGSPSAEPQAVKNLDWQDGHFRNREFQQKWEQIIADWSTRWGSKVVGWWFDGCYWPNTMYRPAEPPNFSTFAGAARKGNSDSIVAFNKGVVIPIHAESDEEDYTAGEMNEPSEVRFHDDRRDVAQLHMLSYLGQSWCTPPVRFTDEQVVETTVRLVKRGGAVTWDVPHLPNGLIPEPFMRQFTALGKALPRQ